MSFLSGGDWTSDPRERTEQQLVQQRRATRSDQLAEATLACAHCDVPVTMGAGRRWITDTLTCPFCGHQGPVRDFLSLAMPTRPTRVVVRIGFGGRR